MIPVDDLETGIVSSADKLNMAADMLGLDFRVEDGYLPLQFTNIVAAILLELAKRNPGGT